MEAFCVIAFSLVKEIRRVFRKLFEMSTRKQLTKFPTKVANKGNRCRSRTKLEPLLPTATAAA